MSPSNAGVSHTLVSKGTFILWGVHEKGTIVFFGAETEENVPEKCTIYTFGAEIPKVG